MSKAIFARMPRLCGRANKEARATVAALACIIVVWLVGGFGLAGTDIWGVPYAVVGHRRLRGAVDRGGCGRGPGAQLAVCSPTSILMRSRVVALPAAPMRPGGARGADIAARNGPQPNAMRLAATSTMRPRTVSSNGQLGGAYPACPVPGRGARHQLRRATAQRGRRRLRQGNTSSATVRSAAFVLAMTTIATYGLGSAASWWAAPAERGSSAGDGCTWPSRRSRRSRRSTASWARSWRLWRATSTRSPSSTSCAHATAPTPLPTSAPSSWRCSSPPPWSPSSWAAQSCSRRSP